MNPPEAEPLHHPSMKDEDLRTGLICFLNIERPCGADCMSWDECPDGPDYKDKQWAHCLLLVNAHRTGKHLRHAGVSAVIQAIDRPPERRTDKSNSVLPP